MDLNPCLINTFPSKALYLIKKWALAYLNAAPPLLRTRYVLGSTGSKNIQ